MLIYVYFIWLAARSTSEVREVAVNFPCGSLRCFSKMQQYQHAHSITLAIYIYFAESITWTLTLDITYGAGQVESAMLFARAENSVFH